MNKIALKKIKDIIRVGLLLLFLQDAKANEFTLSAEGNLGDNLDLNAIASIFGDAKNLEEFERELNDAGNKISNLDLNEDNEVDYLRVVESVSDDKDHVINVQAIIGENRYQDVATIEVQESSKVVQVVGNTSIYGNGYIIQPVYSRPPILFTLFWTGVYYSYHSPFYWGYYHSVYRPWRPYPINVYRRNVFVNVHHNNIYQRVNRRSLKNSSVVSNKYSRNDWGKNKSGLVKNKKINSSKGFNNKQNAANAIRKNSLSKDIKTVKGTTGQGKERTISSTKDIPKRKPIKGNINSKKILSDKSSGFKKVSSNKTSGFKKKPKSKLSNKKIHRKPKIKN